MPMDNKKGFSSSLVGIYKIKLGFFNRTAVYGYFRCNCAVVIFYLDLDLVFLIAVGKSVFCATCVLFLDHVVEGLSDFVCFVIQCEPIVTIACCHRLCIKGSRAYCIACIRFVYLDGEAFARIPFSSAYCLFTGECYIRASRYCVGIYKCNKYI